MGSVNDRGQPASPSSQREPYRNIQPLDDTDPSDRDPYQKGVVVTKTRKVGALTLIRSNPHGFWTIVELPEMGSFTQYEAGVKVAELHQPKQEEDATDE